MPLTAWATTPGTVGWKATPWPRPRVAGAAAAVTAGGGAGVCAAAGAAAAAETASSSTTLIHRDFPRTRDLFRRPAGLADGLALKEPAPPTALTVRLAPTTGSPAPGLHTRDSALMRVNLPN